MRLLCTLAWLSCCGSALNGQRIYHIGDGVSPPIVIQKSDPEYPNEACEAGRQAAYRSGSTTVSTVALSVIVGANGRTQDVKVIRVSGLGLDPQAVKAIRTWRFKPGMKDGRAVPVYATIEVHFGLPEKCFSPRNSDKK
jgi:periplasmic protein TonB